MSCIGTAGHVDHGKSTLVKVLTGIDPDRLAEEKERGMTIDLGFAWLILPGGREVSIVDVPGHESFIKNMLAGVGGIDAALLVVAADEGVMPQTREHLAILDLLHVRRGVVALTKMDLVDEEWLELVREEVEEQLKSTTLEGAPIVPVSAYTGTIGAPSRVVDFSCSSTSSRTSSSHSSSTRSIFVSATTPRRTRSRSRIARCSRVCGMTPSSAATTSRAASMPPTPASIFLIKLSWPGTSTMLTSRPPGSINQAKPRSMVMPRSFSSAKRSGSMPVNTLTRVDFP